MKSRRTHSTRLSLRHATLLLLPGLLALFLVAGLRAAPVPTNKPPTYPAWWFEREVIKQSVTPPSSTPSWPTSYSTANDYAALNQGQLKQLATAAYDELEARLPGGAGADVTALIRSWFVIDPAQPLPTNPALRTPKITANQTNDFAAVNLGMLKTVAQPFYDRLIEIGYATAYPWADPINPPNDFALANLGQAKSTFGFDATKDTDGDGLPDWWEVAHGLLPNDPADGLVDIDGDGVGDHFERAQRTNPTNADDFDPRPVMIGVSLHTVVLDVENGVDDPDRTHIELRWDNPTFSGIQQIKLQRKAGVNAPWETQATISAGSAAFEQGGLFACLKYSYRLLCFLPNHKAAVSEIVPYEVPLIRSLIIQSADSASSFPGFLQLLASSGPPQKYLKYTSVSMEKDGNELRSKDTDEFTLIPDSRKFVAALTYERWETQEGESVLAVTDTYSVKDESPRPAIPTSSSLENLEGFVHRSAETTDGRHESTLNVAFTLRPVSTNVFHTWAGGTSDFSRTDADPIGHPRNLALGSWSGAFEETLEYDDFTKRYHTTPSITGAWSGTLTTTPTDGSSPSTEPSSEYWSALYPYLATIFDAYGHTVLPWEATIDSNTEASYEFSGAFDTEVTWTLDQPYSTQDFVKLAVSNLQSHPVNFLDPYLCDKSRWGAWGGSRVKLVYDPYGPNNQPWEPEGVDLLQGFPETKVSQFRLSSAQTVVEIKRSQYKFMLNPVAANPDVAPSISFQEIFVPTNAEGLQVGNSSGFQRRIYSWTAQAGVSESPVFTSDPITNSDNPESAPLGYSVLGRLSVEMRIADRDDPKKKWADNIVKTAPVYSGKSTGDMVSWKLSGTDSWTNATFSWTAEGPESKTGPSGIGKNEWKIADGDEDIAKDCLDWLPGKYKIRCAISFAGGTTSTAEFDQEIGVRTDDVVVVGWIDPQQVSLNSGGVQSGLTEVLPPGGLSASDGDNAKLKAAMLLKHIADSGVGSAFQIDAGPLMIGVDFIAFSAADKIYALNWMFKYAGNPAPPTDFMDDDLVFSQQEVDEFLTKKNKTLYKLLNHYQARYLVGEDKKFKAESLVHLKHKVLIGNTKDPSRLYEISGLIDWIAIFVATTFQGYPSNGVFPGLARENNSDTPVVTDTTSKLSNEGTPDQKALDAFKHLTGHDQGYIWSTITFFSDMQHYSETTSPSTSQSLTRTPKPAEFYEGRINTQVYPTYWIYINGQKRGVQNQAPNPSALFPNTDKAQ